MYIYIYMFIPISQCEFRELLSLLTTWPEWIIDPRRFWAIAPFVSNSFVDGCRNSSRWRELRGIIFAKQFCLTQNFWQMDSQHQGIQNEKCRDASSLSRFVGFVPSRRGSVFEMPSERLGSASPDHGGCRVLTKLDISWPPHSHATQINKHQHDVIFDASFLRFLWGMTCHLFLHVEACKDTLRRIQEIRDDGWEECFRGTRVFWPTDPDGKLKKA